MSDLADVENALVSSISGFLFSSSYQPYSIATSNIGLPGISLRLMRGWPVDSQLVLDLQAGVTTVSVFSGPGLARNVEKYLRNTTFATTAQVTPTLLAVLSGSNVTFSGTTNIGQTIGIGIRKPGGGYGYSYRLQSSDTPTTVAATFATNMAGAMSSGPVLTIAAPNNQIVVQVGGDVTEWIEVSRNQQIFMVTVWSPTVAIRDTLCSFLDSNLLYINHLYFPDGSGSEPVLGAGTATDDVVQKAYMWKRTLYYSISFPTSYTQSLPVMTLGDDILDSNITLID